MSLTLILPKETCFKVSIQGNIFIGQNSSVNVLLSMEKMLILFCYNVTGRIK